MIQVDQLVKNFGHYPVLREIDLSVDRGEFITLLGPNGAGKTTLLRIIGTLSRPTAGRVQVGGWSLPQRADRVRPHLGLLSHQPLLYAELTAEENMRFYARMYGVPQSEPRITEVLNAVGLNHRRGDVVGSYSRGMQQRLAIARAILHRPDVLLLDEPYTGLDQSAAARLDGLLQAVATEGRTVVLTTHNLARGLANCDRVAVLHQGRIAYDTRREAVQREDFYRVYDRITGGRGNGER